MKNRPCLFGAHFGDTDTGDTGGDGDPMMDNAEKGALPFCCEVSVCNIRACLKFSGSQLLINFLAVPFRTKRARLYLQKVMENRKYPKRSILFNKKKLVHVCIHDTIATAWIKKSAEKSVARHLQTKHHRNITHFAPTNERAPWQKYTFSAAIDSPCTIGKYIYIYMSGESLNQRLNKQMEETPRHVICRSHPCLGGPHTPCMAFGSRGSGSLLPSCLRMALSVWVGRWVCVTRKHKNKPERVETSWHVWGQRSKLLVACGSLASHKMSLCHTSLQTITEMPSGFPWEKRRCIAFCLVDLKGEPFPKTVEQRSLHHTPKHCLVNGGFPLCWWKKPCFKWAKCIF